MPNAPLERARRVRGLVDALAEALDDYDDLTHFEVRTLLGDLLGRVGVIDFRRGTSGATWTFDDIVVDDLGGSRVAHGDPVSQINDATDALGHAIGAIDSKDDDEVVSLRLALRGLLDQVRVQVPEAWEAAVLHEVGAVIRSPLRRGKFRVTEGVVDVLVENGAMTATLVPDSQTELERLWGAVEVEGWFAPGRPYASSGFRDP